MHRQIQSAEIIDIAPTILQLAGLEVPASMDGQSLYDVKLPGPTHKERIDSGSEVPNGVDDTASSGLDPDEEVSMLERLRGLGYV
jgi:arylsulfatase A-like enzyme